MPVSAVERYRELCREFGQNKIVEIEIQLERNPSHIDASSIYLSRKHFKCVCELIKERSEITFIKLDNCSFTSKDLTDFFEALRETRVSHLSLRNVKMSIQDGEQLKELCKLNPHIVGVNLEDTLLPEGLVSTIILAVELNKSLAEERNIEGFYSIVPERKVQQRLNQVQVWPTSALQNYEVVVPEKTKSLSKIMNEIVKNETDYYTDEEFNYEEEYFNQHYAGVKWVRGLSVAKNSGNLCSGKDPVIPSVGWRNFHLCAALNVIQREEKFKNAIRSRDMRDVRCFGFRFFVNDQVKEVLIDDFLPFAYRDGKLEIITAHSQTDDYWGALVEKAIAKLYGGYSKLEHFSFVDFVSLLTGGVCVYKNWRDFPSFTISDYFDRMRCRIFGNTRLIGLAIPQNDNAKKALIESGILPNLPYTLISTDICVKDGNMEYIVQVVGPVTKKPFKGSFQYGSFQESELYGFPVFWMRFADFVIYLGDGCSITWPYADQSGKTAPNITKIEAEPLWPSTNPRFGTNPAYRIECTSEDQALILITFECNDTSGKIAKQFFFYRMNSSSNERRYDISEKNCINSSKPMVGKRGGVLIDMRPGECVQLIVAAESAAKCTIKITSQETFQMIPISHTRSSCVIEGEWNFFYEGKRVPDLLYSFKNISSKPQKNFVVVIGQRLTEQNPFGVSFLAWPNTTSKQVQLYEKAPIQTEIAREVLSVFTISARVDPGSSLVLLPCRHDERCPPGFNVAVYSEGELSVEEERIPRFLFED